MKIIKTGTIYKIYGEDLIVLDKLPAHTYKIGFNEFAGFFLEKQDDLEIKEDKIYGVHNKKVNKVINRFNKSSKNLGVILSGDKGIGKSLFARLLARKAIQNDIPVILVDSYINGITDFINDIKNEVLILFDEFDKTFAKNKDIDPQSNMLSLFDGTGSGKKMFVITCNRYHDLNEYLINRPGRFHFHFRFNYPTAEEVREYLEDKLDKKYYNEINKVVSFSRKIKLNYDCLSAIVLELNEGETFEDAILDLNIVNINDTNKYNIKVFTEEGVIFSNNNVPFNLFSSDIDNVWVEDMSNNSIDIKFKGTDAIFDNTKGVFVISVDKLNISVDPSYVKSSVIDKYENLHFTHAEISLNYKNGIHYNLSNLTV